MDKEPEKLSLELAAGEAIKASSEVQAIVAEMYEKGQLPIFQIQIFVVDMNQESSLVLLQSLLGKGNEC